MTSSVEPTSPHLAVLAKLYAPIADELAQAEEILQREMTSRCPEVDELVRYGWRLGGKRLRPALVLLAGKSLGDVRHDHLVLAAVVEMIHTATLVHDDVLDEADMRRRMPTVNSQWDNELSVLLGDFLFSHAFYLASTLETTYPCQVIGRATNTVCEGEMRQKISRGNFALSESAYTEIIDGKTAALCECSSQLGAYSSNASPEIEKRLQEYGRSLGIAFQIADDVLDLIGDDDVAGKTLGTDLNQNILTLPLIHALRTLPASDRDSLVQVLKQQSEDAKPRLLDALGETGAIAYAQEKAREYARTAQDQISVLDESESKDVMMSIAEFVVDRSH